jgi:hypothetical protein
MNLSFTKLKNAGLPKTSAKFASFTKAPSIKQPSIKAPKLSTTKQPKAFNYSSITKLTKLPKSPKVTILKKAVKKAKAFKFS